MSSVRLLGSQADLKRSQTDEGLKITLPTEKPCDYAYAFKVAGLHK